jgi:hypothetical protein
MNKKYQLHLTFNSSPRVRQNKLECLSPLGKGRSLTLDWSTFQGYSKISDLTEKPS